MRPLINDHVRACERLLAGNLLEVASELRAVDATDLVAWLRGHRYGNLAAMIGSCAELNFKPGTLRFALSGQASLDWSGQLAMQLDMEFHHQDVSCYFRLLLEAVEAGVGITYLTLDGVPCRSALDARRFADALADARRLPPPAEGPPRRRRKFGANKRG